MSSKVGSAPRPDYDDQRERGLVACPICDSHEVAKQIMAPAVAGRAREAASDPAKREMMMEAMGQIRRHVETNFDYVGDSFAREARAIHEGKLNSAEFTARPPRPRSKPSSPTESPIAPLPPEPPKKTEVN